MSSLPNYFDGVVVGGDGQLRHIRAQRSGGSRTALLIAPQNISFRAPPAVVGYGSGQLEVLAVAQNHSLYHWRFQNGVWSNAIQLQGTVISQPVLVHLGSGQMLALAIGTDQHLYLWYFVNGAWSNFKQVSTSVLVNQILFGQLAASSWGEGSVDVSLIEAQTGALYHGRLGPGDFVPGLSFGATPSRMFSLVGGNVIDTPVLTAFGPTRLHLLAIGTDHVVYSNWSTPDYSRPLVLSSQAPPIVWTGYRSIGGRNLLLGGLKPGQRK